MVLIFKKKKFDVDEECRELEVLYYYYNYFELEVAYGFYINFCSRGF